MLWQQRSRLGHTLYSSARRMILSGATMILATACGGSSVSGPETGRMPTPQDPTFATPALKQYAPPAQYALWWEMTRACSGLDRDVSAVRWYSEPADQLRPSDDGTASIAGEWNAAQNAITVVEGAVNTPEIVRHEMLHALLVAGGHPAEKFGSDCAGFVNCEGSCARSLPTRPPVDMNAPRVATSDLKISQRLMPETIDFSKDPDGWFALVVEVRNPSTHAVNVGLRPFPGRADIAATFGYTGARTAQQNYVEGNTISLLPGETQRMVFDLRAKDFIAQNGKAAIRGFFNADSLPELKLNVKQ